MCPTKRDHPIIANFNPFEELSDTDKEYTDYLKKKEISGLKSELDYYLKVKTKVINNWVDHIKNVKIEYQATVKNQLGWNNSLKRKQKILLVESQSIAVAAKQDISSSRKRLLEGLDAIIQQLQTNLSTLNVLEVE